MTQLEIFKAARKLIEKPENWLQTILSQTAKGDDCWPHEPQAAKFCLRGALMANTHKTDPYAQESLRKLASLLPGRDSDLLAPVYYNNSHSHAEVLALLDRAIALETPVS